MLFSFAKKDHLSSYSGATLAAKMRSGPIRAILDRIVRSAAEATGLPYMVLGIRYGDFYEFISTHGIPLFQYRDKVPAKTFPPHLFAREIEVADLRQQPSFAVLSIVPVASQWRYGGNVPVKLQVPLADDGVLALSCADKNVRSKDGKIISILRGYAEAIGDLIWMSEQVEEAVNATDPVGIIKTVLLAGLSRLNMQMCIFDSQLSIIGCSKLFIERIGELGGGEVRPGETLSGPWFSKTMQAAVFDALATELPRQWLAVDGADHDDQLADVYPLSFAELGQFGILALHRGEHARAAIAQQTQKNEVQESAPSASVWGYDGPGPVSRFLFETLLPSRRLYRRGQTSYIGLRKWRAAIKEFQLAALKALKADIPASFVTQIADELADGVGSVYGDINKCVVVPVPCGSSGPNCLACRLAEALAKRLNIPVLHAFEQIEIPSGNSHPRRNIKRQKMRLKHAPLSPVILVDDVVTTGSHIDEAASLLRHSSPHVWPIVWISG